MVVSYLLIILAATAGALLASYIRYKKTTHQVLVCPLHSSCEAVTHSEFSRFLGIPVEVLGIIYYLIIGATYAVFLIYTPATTTPLIIAAVLASSAAFLFSLYLTFIQAVTLRQWCTWCLCSAVLCTLIFLLSLSIFDYNIVPFLAEWQRPILAIHLLGIAFGLGGASITDTLFFKFLKDWRISHEEAKVMKALSQVIWLGIALIVVSGVGLYLPQADYLNHSSKFLLKMVVVSVIIVNGAFLNLFVSPHLTSISFGGPNYIAHGKLHRLRQIAFALGSISATSWYTAFMLGIVRAIPLSFTTLLIIYLGLLTGAITTSQILGYWLTRPRPTALKRSPAAPSHPRTSSYANRYPSRLSPLG